MGRDTKKAAKTVVTLVERLSLPSIKLELRTPFEGATEGRITGLVLTDTSTSEGWCLRRIRDELRATVDALDTRIDAMERAASPFQCVRDNGTMCDGHFRAHRPSEPCVIVV